MAVWLFRKKLARAELIENWSIGSNAKGYIARGGQIVDASIVPVPTTSPSPEEKRRLSAARRRRSGSESRLRTPQKDIFV
jgi:IS5 family transposase